jgi:transcriptional regulator with XRE-family HTH domain
MFYERFEKLCHENGTSPFAMCKQIGLSGGTAAYWKKSGNTPKREALEKIADQFGVSVDYLLGREMDSEYLKSEILNAFNQDNAQKNAPIETNRSEMLSVLSKLTDAELDDLIDYARFLLSKR